MADALQYRQLLQELLGAWDHWIASGVVDESAAKQLDEKIAAARAALSAPLSQPVPTDELKIDPVFWADPMMVASKSRDMREGTLRVAHYPVEGWVPLYADPISPGGLQSHPTDRSGEVPAKDERLTLHITPKIDEACDHEWDRQEDPDHCIKCNLSFTRYIHG